MLVGGRCTRLTEPGRLGSASSPCRPCYLRPTDEAAKSRQRSGVDDLDVSLGRGCEELEIVAIDGDDLVSVPCDEHDDGVDDIDATGERQELPSGSAEWFVHRADSDPGKRLRETSLPSTTPPHLTEDAGMRDRWVARSLSSLQTNPHRTLITLEGDQRPGVQHEAHADVAWRFLCRR